MKAIKSTRPYQPLPTYIFHREGISAFKEILFHFSPPTSNAIHPSLMKVALVHDWLTGMRGGEKCLEVFCEMFPSAHLYTLLHVPKSVSSTIEKMDIRVSALQKMPFSSTHYRYYLPLFPSIVKSWNTGNESYDLVLSSSHCVAKGIRFSKAKRRVCYCFTPMRYLWCQTENYYSGNWRQTALQFGWLPVLAPEKLLRSCGDWPGSWRWIMSIPDKSWFAHLHERPRVI